MIPLYAQIAAHAELEIWSDVNKRMPFRDGYTKEARALEARRQFLKLVETLQEYTKELG